MAIFFSDQLLNLSSNDKIKDHRINNQIIIDNYQSDKNRIDSLLKQLELIKRQDELLRKLVKLPPIEEDVRKMGFGGAQNTDDLNDVNYLFPENDINFDIFRDKVQSSSIKIVRYFHEYGSNVDDIISSLEKETEDSINRVLEILQNRIDQFGVAEPTIQKQGKYRILV